MKQKNNQTETAINIITTYHSKYKEKIPSLWKCPPPFAATLLSPFWIWCAGAHISVIQSLHLQFPDLLVIYLYSESIHAFNTLSAKLTRGFWQVSYELFTPKIQNALSSFFPLNSQSRWDRLLVYIPFIHHMMQTHHELHSSDVKVILPFHDYNVHKCNSQTMKLPTHSKSLGFTDFDRSQDSQTLKDLNWTTPFPRLILKALKMAEHLPQTEAVRYHRNLVSVLSAWVLYLHCRYKDKSNTSHQITLRFMVVKKPWQVSVILNHKTQKQLTAGLQHSDSKSFPGCLRLFSSGHPWCITPCGWPLTQRPTHKPGVGYHCYLVCRFLPSSPST